MTSGRLLAVPHDRQPVFLTEHLARYGPLRPRHRPDRKHDDERLRGRGGGAFPTGQKLRAVAGQRGRPIVVLNGAEASLRAGRNKALLGAVPHLALDGAAAAAAALGAHEVVVAVGRSARSERAILAAALKERRDLLRWRLAVVPDGSSPARRPRC